MHHHHEVDLVAVRVGRGALEAGGPVNLKNVLLQDGNIQPSDEEHLYRDLGVYTGP